MFKQVHVPCSLYMNQGIKADVVKLTGTHCDFDS